MAFQSIKKLLPDSCKCLKHGMLGDLRSRLSRPPPSLPADYLSFARKVSSEIFTKGWDYRWGSKEQTFSPSLGSCIGKSRKHGGQLSTLAAAGQSSWRESLNQPQPGSLEGELLLVDSSGKPRALTRFASEAASLRPLHGLLYDRLSTFGWLCRGDITAEKLHAAGFALSRREEPLTSGDYKSASDNLSIEVAEAILDVAWSNSKHVPSNVFRYAMAAQRPLLAYEDDEGLRSTFVPTRGQMMGSYLCFPLLCLQNYLAFRYAEQQFGVEGTSVLINGDDILFQSSQAFSDFWMSVVGGLGLEVEPTKTSVSTEYGSLNSTLLRWGPSGLRVVKTLRLGMLRPCSHPGNLGDSALLFSRVGPRSTWLLNYTEYLSWHSASILKWRCVASDMGFTGRLALRAWRRYRGGRLLWRDDVLHQMKLDRLPAAHCPHNIVMGSAEFVTVPEDSVTKELRHDSAVWMASRKWELGRGFVVKSEGNMVSERANATRIPAYLNNWATSARELKVESVAALRRKEYHWSDTLNYLGSTKAPKGYERSSSGWRWVEMKRTWWCDRVRREGVRVPKVLWDLLNPPLSPFHRDDLVADLVKSKDGGIFSSSYSALVSDSICTGFRQFWSLNE
nr:MAG: RNA-dependent RNA polymerase [Botourmiaviridae sp.]